MKVLLLFFVLFVVCSCAEYDKSWVETGHINPKDCNEFIVNDSISIKKIDNRYDEPYFTVFVHGKEKTNFLGTFRSTNFNNDYALVEHLQYKYEKDVVNKIFRCDD